MDEEKFNKIIMDSWVNGDRKKCCKRIKDLIEKDYLDKQKHKEIMKKREHTYQINLECAREGADLDR